MGSFKVWLFRGLVIVAAGLMVASFILPWWSAIAPMLGEHNSVTIYPYGLSQDLGMYAPYIKGSAMPGFFTPFMWTYLGVCIVALLCSLWAGEREGRWGRFKFKWASLLIGGVGLSYIVVAVVAVIVAAIRTGDYHVSLLGRSIVSRDPLVAVQAGLRFGYWLAYGVGLFCIVLALLRDKIMGKPS